MRATGPDLRWLAIAVWLEATSLLAHAGMVRQLLGLGGVTARIGPLLRPTLAGSTLARRSRAGSVLQTVGAGIAGDSGPLAGFAAFGHHAGNVLPGVMLYRLISCWGLIPLGWFAVRPDPRHARIAAPATTPPASIVRGGETQQQQQRAHLKLMAEPVTGYPRRTWSRMKTAGLVWQLSRCASPCQCDSRVIV